MGDEAGSADAPGDALSGCGGTCANGSASGSGRSGGWGPVAILPSTLRSLLEAGPTVFPTSSGSAVGAAGRPLPAISATPALILLLLGALALRLVVAYVLFPDSGFSSDIGSYTAWALAMADHGPAGFYGALWSDYPPAYLWVLWPIGIVGQALGGDATGELIKLPAIAVDILVGLLLYRLVLGWTWPGRRAQALALLAAAAWLFNPVTFYDSALWGQTDSIGALVLVCAVAALIRGNSEGAAGLLAVAALVKPQFGVVLAPLVVATLLHRHLFRAGSGPRVRPWAPAALAAWLVREQGPLRLVSAALVFTVVFLVIALPFGLGPVEYLQLMSETAGGYAYLSVNAYNPWALIGAGGTTPLAFAYAWSPDTVPLLGPIPGVLIGVALLAAGFLWAFARVLVTPDRWTLLLAAAWLCLAFFLLPTRVHERYLFPVFVFLPLLLAAGPRWLIALAAVAAGSFINLHGILTIEGYGTPGLSTLPLGRAFGPGQPIPVILSALLQASGFVLIGWELRRRVAPDPYALAAGEIEGAVRSFPVPDRARAVGDDVSAGPGVPDLPRADGMATAGAAATGPRRVGPSPADDAVAPGAPAPDAPSASPWAGIGRSRLAGLLGQPRIRADRSAGLARERGGTLTRRDAVAVLAVFVAAVALRGAGLAHPYGMYFDEVYHARTALEFLQHWRYGVPHDIYEYTHPHLAKYAMAAGVELAGGNTVTGTGALGVAGITDAVVERRRAAADGVTGRSGDRLWFAAADGVHARDLGGGPAIGPVGPAATALALDADAQELYIADATGGIHVLATFDADAVRSGAADAILPPELLGTLPPGAPVADLALTWEVVVALRTDGTLVSLDRETGAVRGEGGVPGGTALAVLPDAEALVARPAEMSDLADAGGRIAEALGRDAGEIADLLAAPGADGTAILRAWPDGSVRDTLTGPIEDGRLAGVTFTQVTPLAVAGAAGGTIVDAVTLTTLRVLEGSTPALGVGLLGSGVDRPVLYVAANGEVRSWSMDATGPIARDTIVLPGAGGPVLWNDTATLVHVAGTTADGAPTVWVIEPHGDSLFADARLPFTPTALALDLQPDRPGEDRTALVAIAEDGRTATVGVGGNAFAWRLPGVLAGALTAALLFLLARILFRRRAVALVVAFLALAEGMLYANARIAMNDVYVTLFIVAAATLFAGLWTGRWQRAWQVAAGLVGIGLLLGLALASKWVAAYAIGGFALLVLLRSALGRLIALAGMVAITGVLGTAALRAPDVPDPSRNWFFPLVMVALTLALGAAIVRRPIRFTLEELRFAIGLPAVAGVLAIVAGVALWLVPADPAAEPGPVTPLRLLVAGAATLMVAAGVAVAGVLGGQAGIGPLARVRRERPGAPELAPAPDGWLRPGAALGVPWLFALACLAVLPVAVYVLAYLPWANLGNQLWPGFPAGNGGQTLWQLTLGMYDYHDGLRATHAASSPWWAWLLDLKPVWFYQEGFAEGRVGAIYDTANLVVFWLGIAGLLFCAWAAWTRRSLALTLVIVLFLALWIPWARIDRATFQYHVYTSIPMIVLALAYLVAELWHGPSRVAWAVARYGAALALLGAPLLWILRGPLCGIAGVEAVNAGASQCAAEVTRTVGLSPQVMGAALALLAGATVAAWIVQTAQPTAAGERGGLLGRTGIALGVTALATIGGVVAARVLLPAEPVSLLLADTLIAPLAFLALLVPAALIVRARDPRRLAGGILVAAALFFVAWLPNISGLPLPSSLAYIYGGLLPTWDYSFQFSVNMDPRIEGGMLRADTLVLTATLCIVLAALVPVARGWGARSGPRPADPGLPPPDASPGPGTGP
ncbi:MAG: phospholipid carrier-dependent glycosyltransferase, partial [Chloroflexota bacterium]